MNVDMKQIDKFIEGTKKKKPKFIVVDDAQWEEALLGYQECLSEGITPDMTTDQFWTILYFSAVAFCKGMEYAEVKAGTRKESFYPRY